MDTDRTFYTALEEGQCDVVDQLLSTGYQPNKNCIIPVCKTGDLHLLEKLLKFDMNVQLGMSIAVKNRNINLLDRLFLAGANIHLPDEHEKYLIHQVKDLDTCKWLLDMGGPGMISLIDSDGNTPLYIACIRHDVELAKLLLTYEEGVKSILVANKYGNTPLHNICWDGDTEIAKLLLTYEQGLQSMLIFNENGGTPFHFACETKRTEIVELLLQYDQGIQSISMIDNNGDTLLHLACVLCNNFIVESLLSRKQGVQTISIANNKGDTPLHLACKQRDTRINELLDVLLPHEQAEQSILAVNKNGLTPLDIAAKNPDIHDNIILFMKQKAGLRKRKVTFCEGNDPI